MQVWIHLLNSFSGKDYNLKMFMTDCQSSNGTWRQQWMTENRIGGVMVRVKPKTIKLVFVASPLSTQHYGERVKTGWFDPTLGKHANLHHWHQ
jgi:hypothetical protein